MSLSGEVYTRLLLQKGHGFPLSNPNPAPVDNLPIHYRDRGVGIGDVGIITSDGTFDFLFSICLPFDHTINHNRGLPTNFEDVWPYIRVMKDADFFLPGSVIFSARVSATKAKDSSARNNPVTPVSADTELYVTSDTSEGAILFLPEGGSRSNLLNQKIFVEQALKHGLSWYECANRTRRQKVENGSLFLVTGCDKTASWGIASFTGNSEGRTVSLRFVATRGDAGQTPYTWETEYPGPAFNHCSPASRTQDIQKNDNNFGFRERKPTGKENQCVFIRGFRISRTAGFAALRGRVKLTPPENVPSAVSRRSNVISESASESKQGGGDERQEVEETIEAGGTIMRKTAAGKKEQDGGILVKGAGEDMPLTEENRKTEEQRRVAPKQVRLRSLIQALQAANWMLKKRASEGKRRASEDGVHTVVGK